MARIKETLEARQAEDGTRLKLRRIRRESQNEDEYIVTEAGSTQRTGEIARTVAEGRKQLKRTAELYGSAAQSRSKSNEGGFSRLGSFGGSDQSRRESQEPEQLFGGGLFDDGNSQQNKREQKSGENRSGGFGDVLNFGSAGRDGDGFVMERDDNGRFVGRKNSDEDESKGLFDLFK